MNSTHKFLSNTAWETFLKPSHSFLSLLISEFQSWGMWCSICLVTRNEFWKARQGAFWGAGLPHLRNGFAEFQLAEDGGGGRLWCEKCNLGLFDFHLPILQPRIYLVLASSSHVSNDNISTLLSYSRANKKSATVRCAPNNVVHHVSLRVFFLLFFSFGTTVSSHSMEYYSYSKGVKGIWPAWEALPVWNHTQLTKRIN